MYCPLNFPETSRERQPHVEAQRRAVISVAEQLALFPEMVAKPDVQHLAGGATQNSIRVAQWMIEKPKATSYVGCVGTDDFAARLRACAQSDGVAVHYMEDPTTPTGNHPPSSPQNYNS